MKTLEAVTLAIAVVGAVLGLLNTWRTFSLDRLRMRVVAVGAASVEGLLVQLDGASDKRPDLVALADRVFIEVVNLSTFPVTIIEVGFDSKAGGQKFVMPPDSLLSDDQLPKRMEARTSVTASVKPGAGDESDWLRRAGKPYVLTACGKKIEGVALPAAVVDKLTRAAPPRTGDK